MVWNKLHGEILQLYFEALDKADIKFFVIRNYEGLPESNASKDVDIVLKHGSAPKAEKILKRVFKSTGLHYYYRIKIEESLLCRAISINGDFAIHIDLMNGYINRGIELFSFEELYSQTINYNGFRVLNDLYNGIMLFIYKQFGYKKPYLKKEYQETIYETWKNHSAFSEVLKRMIGEELFKKIELRIENHDFDKMLSYSKAINNKLRVYSNKQKLIKNTCRKALFLFQKVDRILLRYRKYEKTISVMAPDGAGKTTFLQNLLEKLAFLYVDDPNDIKRFHVYHFRPSLLPNLGEIGEKVNVMKQDKDFTNPHRAKPVGFFSSLLRITYYWLDYTIGWMYFTRKDVQYDYYTIYDRYSYDMVVDPGRTRLRLPTWIRSCYVKYMPHPKINFFLKVDANVIFGRKAELTLEEINRQIVAYDKLAKNNNIITLDASKSSEEISDAALVYIIEKYWDKL